MALKTFRQTYLWMDIHFLNRDENIVVKDEIAHHKNFTFKHDVLKSHLLQMFQNVSASRKLLSFVLLNFFEKG